MSQPWISPQNRLARWAMQLCTCCSSGASVQGKAPIGTSSQGCMAPVSSSRTFTAIRCVCHYDVSKVRLAEQGSSMPCTTKTDAAVSRGSANHLPLSTLHHCISCGPRLKETCWSSQLSGRATTFETQAVMNRLACNASTCHTAGCRRIEGAVCCAGSLLPASECFGRCLGPTSDAMRLRQLALRHLPGVDTKLAKARQGFQGCTPLLAAFPGGSPSGSGEEILLPG